MKSDLNSTKSTDISFHISAIVAGLGLLIMAILAPIANFGVLQKLIVSGDVTNTANNIIASAGRFRIGICVFLINVTIAMFTFIGEVLLIFWLLWRGIKGFDKGSELK